MNIKYAESVNSLPKYLFAEIDELKAKEIEKGVDIIDVSIGDPDIPTPEFIIEELYKTALDKKNHRYPSYVGMLSFREAACTFMKNRFGVSLNPKNEAIALIGSKEGIGHFPFAFVNPGDVVLCPNPGYPVYRASTIVAGGEYYAMPLLEKNGFFPDFGAIPEEKLKKAKIMFLNYPNNPTSATADIKKFESVVEIAKKYDIIIAHDNAYSEVYNKNKPISFLQAAGAMDVGIEFHSLSKTFNMTGWRIGFAVGNSEIIKGLAKIKENMDSGVFQAVQYAGAKALLSDMKDVEANNKIYNERRAFMTSELSKLGYEICQSDATFYLWVKNPKGLSSADIAKKFLTEAGIVVTAGNGFGDYGEGYFRIALTVDIERFAEAINRIKKINI